MVRQCKVVHYLNQFFGGIGGEEQAYAPVQERQGPVGPGRALQKALGDRATIVGSIIAGDNYFTEELEPAKTAVEAILQRLQPDLVMAGPAFDAGRYGLACAEVCRLAQARGIPAVTGMHPDNAGVLTYRRDLVAIATGTDTSEMVSILGKMADLGMQRLRQDELGPAVVAGTIPRGIRREVRHAKPGYARAVEMLTARLAGKPHRSEMLLTSYDVVPPAAPIPDLSRAVVALASSGGVVPRGNADGLVGARAEQFFRYDIDGVASLAVEDWESVHGGFSTVILNHKNPNYAMPLSLTRTLESQGSIRAIYPYFFSTTGNGTAVTSARRMGAEIARELRQQEVDGVLLVAT